MTKLLKIMLWLIIGILALLTGIFLFYILTAYRPEHEELLEVYGTGEEQSTNKNDTLTFITWNIGYAGLGKEMDFFYEGGTMVKPAPDLHRKYIDAILTQLHQFDSADFILLQEIDQNSKRTYYTNQEILIRESVESHFTVYATNFRSPFIPVPLSSPMGKVHSGMMTLSRLKPVEAVRYAFPEDHPWPLNMFMLKRCYILCRFDLKGKELVLINTHNSAYDSSGTAKTIQLEMLRSTILEEYSKGNIVIAGGDWNQNPPGFDVLKIGTNDKIRTIDQLVPDDLFPEGWAWIFDPSLPTNRDVNVPYSEGEVPTTVIDFFVVPPEVEVLDVRTLDLHFEYADHNPVYMKIRIP